MRFTASGSPIAPRPITPTRALMVVLLSGLARAQAGLVRRHPGRRLGAPVGIRAVPLRAAAQVVRGLQQRIVVPRQIEELRGRLLDVPGRVHEALEVVALRIEEEQAPRDAV